MSNKKTLQEWYDDNTDGHAATITIHRRYNLADLPGFEEDLRLSVFNSLGGLGEKDAESITKCIWLSADNFVMDFEIEMRVKIYDGGVKIVYVNSVEVLR